VAVPALAATLLLVFGGEEAGRRDGAAGVEPTTAVASLIEASPPDSAPVMTASPLPSTTSTGASMATTTEPPGTTTTQAVAPGGALTKQLVADIATAFGYPVSDVEAAIAEVELPPEASGNPEGWLAPGTYQVENHGTALDVVQAMVDRRVAQLSERAIPRDQWHRVLTAASVIEKETYNQNEKPGVARVLTNRLAGGGPLQMDSIILYPISEDRIFTTSEERASDQPYNSYRHNGLPPTPICSPDEESIDAFLSPAPGDWWFYVTIDLHSGETRYAVTYEEHLANVELLRAWLRANPTP
jgi:UPF0755 protein